jgi:hypothetical protein
MSVDRISTMAIHPKKLLEELSKKKERARGPFNVYLDKDLVEAFKKACGDVPRSKVIEALMRQFIEDSKVKR